MEHFIEMLKLVWPQLLLVGPGFFALWKFWSENRRLKRTHHADLIKLSEEIAARALTRLENDNRELRERVDALEDEVREYQKERLEMLQTHAASMAEKDATIAVLRGEKRQLAATVRVYDQLLTQHGIPHTRPQSPHWEVDGSDALTPAQEVPVP